MIAHDCGCGVEELCDFVVGQVGKQGGQEVDIVATTGLDEEFFGGCALGESVFWSRRGCEFCVLRVLLLPWLVGWCLCRGQDAPLYQMAGQGAAPS